MISLLFSEYQQFGMLMIFFSPCLLLSEAFENSPLCLIFTSSAYASLALGIPVKNIPASGLFSLFPDSIEWNVEKKVQESLLPTLDILTAFW